MPIPSGSLIIAIKRKGKNIFAHRYFTFYIKIKRTNITFSFNSTAINKVEVTSSRLRYPGFHATGYLVYPANIVCHFLSTSLSHRTGRLSKNLRPRCSTEVAAFIKSRQQPVFFSRNWNATGISHVSAWCIR
jgi:hypothetical protein